MKLANIKAMLVKGATVGLLAGAFALAGPAKADAQQVAVVVPARYPHHGHYDHLRFERHEAWVRAHEYRRFHDGYVYHRW